MMSIKHLLDNNYIIVLDTNVLLNVYRYSPEFSNFAMDCLNAVKPSIYLPATVDLEYKKHYHAEFSKMKRKVANVGNETEKQIKLSKEKILNSCNNLDRLQFPDVGGFFLVWLKNIIGS